MDNRFRIGDKVKFKDSYGNIGPIIGIISPLKSSEFYSPLYTYYVVWDNRMKIHYDKNNDYHLVLHEPVYDPLRDLKDFIEKELVI